MLGLIAVAFGLGAARVWPYAPLHGLYNDLARGSGGPNIAGDSDVLRRYRVTPQMIGLPTRVAVLRRRESLQRFVFGRPPDQIDPDGRVTVANATGRFHLDGVSPARVDRLTIHLAYGVTSTVYVFYPRNPSGVLVLDHQGHEAGRSPDLRTVSFLVRHRNTVAALQMPLTGMNNHPIASTPFGPVRLVRHQDLALLDGDGHTGLRILLEPVAITLNLLTRQHGWRRIAMVGLSAGGWTTTVYAAMDPRIELTFPVAGTLPLPLHFEGVGDWEQFTPRLYLIADYPQLYVLGAYGYAREQLQILHLHDDCCFGGDFRSKYVPAVQQTLRRLGQGKFNAVVLDETAHAISPVALRVIEQQLGSPAS